MRLIHMLCSWLIAVLCFIPVMTFAFNDQDIDSFLDMPPVPELADKRFPDSSAVDNKEGDDVSALKPFESEKSTIAEVGTDDFSEELTDAEKALESAKLHAEFMGDENDSKEGLTASERASESAKLYAEFMEEKDDVDEAESEVTVEIKPEFSKAGASVISEKAAYAPNMEIKVIFSNAMGNSKDWIGLYEEAAENEKYLSYQYLEGQKDGELVFKLPTDFASGKVNFRLFKNDGYDHFSTSNTVAILPKLHLISDAFAPGEDAVVDFAGVGHDPKSWVGLYRFPDTGYGKPIIRQSLDGKGDGALVFTMPEQAGSYFFRLFVSDKVNNHDLKLVETSKLVTVGDTGLVDTAGFELAGLWKRGDGLTIEFEKESNGSYTGRLIDVTPIGNYGFYSGEVANLLQAVEGGFKGLAKWRWMGGRQEWKETEYRVEDNNTLIEGSNTLIRQ